EIRTDVTGWERGLAPNSRIADGPEAGREVLSRGLRVLGVAIREQPWLFSIAVAGSILFGVLIVASAYLVGWVVGDVAVPAIARGRVDAGGLALRSEEHRSELQSREK